MKKFKIIIALLLLMSMVTLAHSFTRDYDTSDPVDHTLNSKWPAEIREVMVDVAERLTDSFYGFASGETLVGVKNLPFNVQGSDPGATASQIKGYSKDVSAKAEWFLQDEDANVIQMTDAGKINSAALSGSTLPSSWQDKVWPVGSIFISTVSTNPNTLLGFGTWAAWGAGKVIVGLDAGDADFDTSEETGGVKEVTLTAAQSGLPAHTHPIQTYGGSASNQAISYTGSTAQSSSVPNTNANSAAAAAEAHTNLQPYIVAFLWERTS